MEIVSYSQRYISAWADDEANNTKWIFIGLYRELEIGKCHVTWELLLELKPRDYTLWLVIGDFDEILFNIKKVEDKPREEKQKQKLGHKEEPFTSSNNDEDETFTKERLDRP